MSIEVKISKRPISYKIAMKILLKRVEKLKKNKGKELLWILEHPITYTAGIRSNSKEILDKKIKIINTNRGGKITLHNPGQKVIYFALNLNKRKRDIRKLITLIEKSIIEFLHFCKIKGIRDKKNIGIWVNKKKIAAIGVRISRWIAYHGCSININNNLNLYRKILPCGLDNQKITSVYSENGLIKKNIEKKLKSIFIKNIKRI
ncbi:MAG: lipoyl(octanoyl) transferase [Candidatus Pelagibacter sp. TMED128]|nr:MAG: lipoyl(octanoyl) transferase [Candidatus Pelagibacter sp. TMED128]|tara:strand:+ start:300 stop:911 length:612 start_codon:yes stop_codon:yes gene_type:complete